MKEFDIGMQGKYNKQEGLNKERGVGWRVGVSQKNEMNKRIPPVYSARKSKFIKGCGDLGH